MAVEAAVVSIVVQGHDALPPQSCSSSDATVDTIHATSAHALARRIDKVAALGLGSVFVGGTFLVFLKPRAVAGRLCTEKVAGCFRESIQF